MPSDWRRFTGPDVSVPYATYVPNATKTPAELREALLDSKKKRVDGRELNESRPLFVKTGVVSQAKGSAYLELNNTKVICSVFAPREIPNKNEFSRVGQLYCEVKLATFSCARQRRSYAPEADERELSAALRRALEPAVLRNKFPNYQVDVMVLILEQDGGALAAAVTAAGLALADAAVPMYDIICAATLAVLHDKRFMDPTEAEEYACVQGVRADEAEAGGATRDHGLVTLAFMPQHQQICDLTLIGSMDVECVTNSMDDLEKEIVEKVVPAVEDCLLKHIHLAIRMKQRDDEDCRDKEEQLRKQVEAFKEIQLRS